MPYYNLHMYNTRGCAKPYLSAAILIDILCFFSIYKNIFKNSDCKTNYNTDKRHTMSILSNVLYMRKCNNFVSEVK